MLLCIPSVVHAENDIALGAGWFDIDRGDSNEAANFLAEWRGSYFFYNLRPVVGGTANTDGGLYGYAGFQYDWEFVPHWILTPGLDVGLWRRGSSIDLGGPVEFHESMELDYRFDDNIRAGIEASHTSNADMYSNNPGADAIMFVVSFPAF